MPSEEEGGKKTDGIRVHRLRGDTDSSAGDRPRNGDRIKEVRVMPIVFAVAGSPLACFMEGCVLGASVFLVAKGMKNPPKKK